VDSSIQQIVNPDLGLGDRGCKPETSIHARLPLRDIPARIRRIALPKLGQIKTSIRFPLDDVFDIHVPFPCPAVHRTRNTKQRRGARQHGRESRKTYRKAKRTISKKAPHDHPPRQPQKRPARDSLRCRAADTNDRIVKTALTDFDVARRRLKAVIREIPHDPIPKFISCHILPP
jgi:hypothetical protein